MAASSILTPGMQQVRRVADLALTSTSGMAVEFLVTDHGSLENANKAARGFQTAFSSFRIREHRKAQRRGGESASVKDSDIIGPYDRLSAFKRDLPSGLGFEVRLVTTHAINLGMRVRDLDTGEIVPQLDPELMRWEAVTSLMFKTFAQRQAAKLPMIDPLESHDIEWMRITNADSGETLYEAVGLVAPWVMTAPVSPTEFGLEDLEGDIFGEEGEEP